MFGFQPIPDDGDESQSIPPEISCNVRNWVQTTSSGTSHTINIPDFDSGTSNCVLVIAIEGSAAAPTISGWTRYRSINIANSTPITASLSVYVAESAGLGGTLAVTTSGTVDLTAFAYEVTCEHLGGGQSDSSGTTAVPPTPTGSSTDDVLQLCAIIYASSGSVSAFSAGYTEEYHIASNGAIGLAAGWRHVEGGVEKPGDITITVSNIWAIAVEVF